MDTMSCKKKKKSLVSPACLRTMQVNIWSRSPSLVQVGLQLFKWDHFHISAYLTTWPQMTFDLGTWPLTAWTYESLHIISINQVWFKSDFNFSNKAIFTFLAYLTTWPQMTFDLDMWPLTSSTNEGSHIVPMTQLWLKSIKACGS